VVAAFRSDSQEIARSAPTLVEGDRNVEGKAVMNCARRARSSSSIFGLQS
jgi:hypothetical protein